MSNIHECIVGNKYTGSFQGGIESKTHFSRDHYYENEWVESRYIGTGVITLRKSGKKYFFAFEAREGNSLRKILTGFDKSGIEPELISGKEKEVADAVLEALIAKIKASEKKGNEIPFVYIEKPKLEDLIQKGIIPDKDCQWHLQTAST